jgi:hypothetical protein
VSTAGADPAGGKVPTVVTASRRPRTIEERVTVV